MSGTPIHRVIADLKSLRERATRYETQFMSNPLCALGIFGEGHCDWDELQDPTRISEFLNLPMDQFSCVKGVTFGNGDTAHKGPYYVYLRYGKPPEDAQVVFQPQFDAISHLAACLYDCLQGIHRIHPGLLSETESWWQELFYLEIHYPQVVREPRRDRWVNITGLAPGVHQEQTLRRLNPRQERVEERRLQFGQKQAPIEDIVPGVIWCRLHDDVITSSIRAIDHLISRLETYSTTPKAIDLATVRARFAVLHQEFTLLAEPERWRRQQLAGKPLPEAPVRLYSEGRLVKVASSFTMPPANTWCGFPMEFEFDYLLLSKHYGDAEYFVHRGMTAKFHPICEAAGNALPNTATDQPVMFHRPIGSNGEYGVHSLPCPALNTDPAAKWVRFVFNSLRQNDLAAEEIRIQFQDAPSVAPCLFHDIFGFATLRDGFFAASARAIELAGLLPRNVAEHGVQTPVNPNKPKQKSGKPPLSKTNPQLVNLYDSVIAEWKPNRPSIEIIDALHANRDVVELAKEQKLTIDSDLIRKAKKYRKENPK